MQIERIVTWDGVIYKDEKAKMLCVGCCHHYSVTKNSLCLDQNTVLLFPCKGRIWKRIGTMPKVGKKCR